jgi:hypothetical protein
MTHVVGTQLEFEKRLASLRVLGASPTETSGRSSAQPETAAEKRQALVTFIGWGFVAIALVAACVAFNLLSTSLLLWGVWAVLQLVMGSGA